MSISLLNLNDFAQRFSGNENAHGVNQPLDEYEENGKRKSKNFTKSEKVTEKLYQDHLEGKTGLGIVPIRSDNTCVFSVIDIDIYGEAHIKMLTRIDKMGLPLVAFRSKSGGLHLYIFWSTPVKAKDAVDIMMMLRRVLNIDKKTEIFPKQTFIKADDSGNWINLPYFNAEKTERPCLNAKGIPLSLDEALFYIQDREQTKENILNIIANLPLADAPPCLQALYLSGDVQNRNNYLFSLARYYKTKMGDDFEFALVEANGLLDHPLPIKEIQDTIISMHKKKEYSYKCKDEPIVSICDKEECRKRVYGIGGNEVSELSFGSFTQYASDPPFYEWIINEKPLKFWSESDIIGQQTFRNLCFRHLGILPFRLTDVAWTKIINNALQNMTVKTIDQETDISTGSLFLDYIAEFLTARAMANNKDGILADRVYRDEEKSAYVFKPKQLLIFLIQQKQFRSYGLTEIQDRLRTMGAEPTRYYVDSSNRSVRVWLFPFAAIEKFIDPDARNVEVEFETKGDEDGGY